PARRLPLPVRVRARSRQGVMDDAADQRQANAGPHTGSEVGEPFAGPPPGQCRPPHRQRGRRAIRWPSAPADRRRPAATPGRAPARSDDPPHQPPLAPPAPNPPAPAEPAGTMLMLFALMLPSASRVRVTG